jgi:hypothetical protein
MTTLTTEAIAALIVKSSIRPSGSQVMIVSPQGKGPPRKETWLSGMGVTRPWNETSLTRLRHSPQRHQTIGEHFETAD